MSNGSGIVVLGMHRSGTSLLTAVLSELGFHGGSKMIGPEPSNIGGHWEHAAIVRRHSEFLFLAGYSWDYPGIIPPDTFKGISAEHTAGSLANIMESELLGHARWVLKDPRMCRLLPIWALDPLKDLPIHWLHVIRSPIAVARSLNTRDGHAMETALMLWLRHHLEAERGTRGQPRAFISLESFLAEPERVLHRSFEHLGIAQDIPAGDIAGAVLRSVHNSQIHSTDLTEDRDQLASAYPLVLEAWHALTFPGGQDARGSEQALDAVSAKLALLDGQLAGPRHAAHDSGDDSGAPQSTVLGRLLREPSYVTGRDVSRPGDADNAYLLARCLDVIHDIEADREAVLKESTQLRATIENVNRKLDAQRNSLHKSLSWRITAPMRMLGSLALQAVSWVKSFRREQARK